MNPVTSIVLYLSKRMKTKRANLFNEYFTITPETRILDIGSSDGSYVAALLHGTKILPSNVYIADICEDTVNSGAKRFGFTPVVVQESNKLLFPDGFFDIVFCNSVIEHVTIPKDEIWSLYSGSEFRMRSLLRQKEFADEIRRIGKGYFVQTPNRWFPIESHAWLPFTALLPRTVLILMLKVSNRIWVKQTSPDWYLLSKKEMTVLFPDATLLNETFAGFTKSIICVKN